MVETNQNYSFPCSDYTCSMLNVFLDNCISFLSEFFPSVRLNHDISSLLVVKHFSFFLYYNLLTLLFNKVAVNPVILH
jgi:hypothetical protein